ncbi:MAG: M17 family peptidase N-terminal domain-containing protein, partial [Bacteroidota bacterium]
MNLHAIASLSDAPESAAIICLLSTKSGSETFGTVSSASYDESWAKAGKKNLISHEGRTLICLGMGDAPTLEHYRKAAHTVFSTATGWGMNEVTVVSEALSDDQAQAFVEGAILSAYRFTRHV